MKGKFNPERRPTVGADFMSKRLVLHSVEVNLQVWDTAGQERFHQGNLTSHFYRGSHGAMIVYDVNNEESFEIVKLWRDEVLSHTENEHRTYFPVIVIGNMIDIRETIPEDMRVDQSPLLQWCRENSYGHIETSAKDGSGVEAAMHGIVGLALELQKEDAKIKELELITQENTMNNLGNQRKPSTSRSTSGYSKDHNGNKIQVSKLYEPKRDSFCPAC